MCNRRNSLFGLFVFICSACFSFNLGCLSDAHAEDDVKLFADDVKNVQERKERRQSQILKPKVKSSSDLKFDAPKLEFDKENNKIKGTGGVIISYQGFTAQADEGSVETQSKDASLDGDVSLAWPDGTIGCDSAKMNLDSETGVFEKGHAIWEEGQYKIDAEEIHKVSEFDYRFDNSSFTTCHCEDGSCPWKIRSKRLDVRQDGYGKAHDAWFEMFGLPIFYTPYMLFPVKTERQSGLLAPKYGYGSKDGVLYSQPIFVVIDDQSDVLLEPFIQNKTRRGTSVEVRDVFSERSNITTKFLYSDESPRGKSLRGTRVDGLYDPTFDEDRYGVYAKQTWKNEQDAKIPLSLNSDIHYVSDDLFLREIDDNDFGLYNQRFATSTVTGTANLNDNLTAAISSEYNQALYYDNDDYVFQRLPQVNLNARKNLRPFGYNPYGLKLQTSAGLDYTQFTRDKGYDGGRIDLNPNVKVPYHYKNYFNGQFGVGMHYTSYFMDDKLIPNAAIDGPQTLDDGDRAVADLTYTLTTGVEKVYDLDADNPLTWLTSVGYGNRDRKLRRIKHTIEPIFGYRYVPYTKQEDLPLYDSLDRIRHKSLFLYGIKTSLYGRYLPDNAAGEDIAELTPEVEDLPTIDSESALPDLDMPKMFDAGLANTNVRNGETREIMSFFVRQTYDYVKDEDNDDTTDPFSDVSMTYTFDPTPYVGLSATGNYDYEDSNFSSWEFNTKLADDRRDALRFGYSFLEDQISQLTTGVELTLTDRYRAGYYARFDDKKGDFLENLAAIRYINPCNCWHVDLGYRERLNPDKKDIMLTLTFRGLGSLAQSFGVGGDTE